VCSTYLGPVCLFHVFVFFVYLLLFVLSASASDCLERLSLKLLITCRAGCKTLLTHSLSPVAFHSDIQ